MHHSTHDRPRAKARRTQRPMLSPYVLDDTAFTLSDIRQARAESEFAGCR
jgi:hypothetical protein